MYRKTLGSFSARKSQVYQEGFVVEESNAAKGVRIVAKKKISRDDELNFIYMSALEYNVEL